MASPDLDDSPTWVATVARDLARWAGRRPLVVAVSGGADSVALLRLAARLAPACGLRLTVAHLHHGVRPAADADAEFVAELSASLGLPCEIGRWRPTRPTHFEADARHARYRWLAEVAASLGTPAAVATAHTRDDQAETILHRILRGTGPRGLGGMARRRPLADGVSLIRPLLPVRRADLAAYLTALGQAWREDATNRDTARTRARIRHELLPGLADAYNPAVADALVRLGRRARAEHRWIERRAERQASRSVEGTVSGGLAADLDALRTLPPFLRAEVLRAAWRAAGWPERAMSEAAWTRLARLAAGQGGAVSLPGGVRARVETGRLLIEPLADADLESPIPPADWLPIPGSATWGGVRLTALDAPGDGERVDLDRLAAFDRDGVPSLLVRAPQPGDRFGPLGLDGHSRRLVEFLRERRVTPAARRRVPLVCDRAGIVWVVGHRIAERVKLTEATRRILTLGGGVPSLGGERPA
jgi:tRNA(Ile)-lysidine synthase